MHPSKVFAMFLAVALAVALGPTPVRAETVNCTAITTLPAVITTQGIYCFTGHLSTSITSGAAIDIQTNNVIVDLNGFKLGGLAGGFGTTAIGVQAANRQNVTVKNGTIRGYFKGISLTDSGASQGHVVEDVRADQNTFVGIEVNGSGNIVRTNQVVTTGGSTTFGANASAQGILMAGSGPRALNNDVINTFKAGTGVSTGILFNGATGKYRDNLTFGVTTPFTGGTPVGTND